MKPKTRILPILILFFVIFSVLFVSISPVFNPVQAATGINKQINFQGKVVNDDGTNVANGDYDFVFKIWDDPSAGSTVWTETWNSGTAQVTVTDGVFRVALGTHTTFPGSVDFNTDNLYLSVNFDGDGDMTPRIRFSAVPYAFNAMAFGGANGETITNTVDDEITFTGTGGGTNQALTFDLDDGTRAIITSSTSTSIGIDEDLVFIGAQTISTSDGADLTIGTNDVNFTATGGSTGNADVDIDGYLQVGGTAEFDGAINADSTLTATGTLTADGTLDANGVVTLGDGGDAVTIDSNALILQTTGAGTDITINAVDQIILTDFTGGGSGCSLDTDGSGNLVCGTDDAGTNTLWNAIGDAGGNGAIEFASTTQTMDWTDSATDGSYFVFNFDNADATAGTDNFVVINNAVSTNSGGVDLNTENLLLIQQLDTTASGTTVVDNGIKIDSAANSGIVDGLEITNSGGNMTNAINIADNGGGLIATGINYSGTLTTGIVGGATFTTAIDLSSGSSTTDLILDDGLTIAQTSDNNLDFVENSLTLNWDFGETTASTITENTASNLEFESTANSAAALKLESTLGGIDIFASGAGAGEDIDIIATGSSVNVTSTEGSADGIVLRSTNGGIDIISTGSAAGEDFDFSSAASVNISAAEAATDGIVIDSSANNGGVRIIAGDNEATTLGNGNDIELKAEDDTIVSLTAAGQLVIDAATNVDSTATTGTIDIDIDTITNTASGLNLNFQVGDTAGDITAYAQRTDVIVDNDASQSQTVTGHYIGITANDASSTTYGLQIIAEDAGAQVVTAGLVIDNLQATDIDMTTGILIRATTNDSIATAIDVSDAEITTALSVGANTISGTTGLIDYTNFDVSAAGNITVAAAEGLDTNGAGALELGKANATSLDICNSTACDTINIGNLATTDADTIIIGDVLDNVSITADDWSITDAGALTVTSCTGCGGGGSGWTDDGDIIRLTTAADSVTIGTASDLSAQLAVDGISDQIQLLVQANGTQTTYPFVIETSGGTDLFSVDNNGTVRIASTGSNQVFEILNTGGYEIYSSGDNDFNLYNSASGRHVMINSNGGNINLGPSAGSSTFQVQDDSDILVTFGAANEFTVDASTTPNTTTAGVIDLNVNAGNAAVLGLNIDFIQNTGASTGLEAIAQNIVITGNDADANVIGLQITSAATGISTAGTYEALIRLVNAENSAGIVADGILIDSTSGTDGDIVDGIDVSDPNIENAINIGANAIAGTNFSVTGAGALTVSSCTGCGGGGGTLQQAYDAGATILTDATGDIIFQLIGGATDTAFKVDSVSAPEKDMMVISNSGFATSTDNVDGLYINFAATGATSTDASALHLDLDPSAGTSDDTYTAVLVDGITGTSAVENAVTIGTGWDIDINFADTTAVLGMASGASLAMGTSGADMFTIDLSANTMRMGDGSNGITFDVDGSSTIFTGTARPTRTVTLVPEYAGATLTPDGSANSGSMTTDFCSDLRTVNTAATPTNASPCDSDLSEEHNYYTWTSTSASQDYDIWVRWQVPTDFGGWDTLTNAVQVYGWRTDGTNAVTVSMFDTAGAAVGSATNVATGTGAWTQTTVVSTPTGTYTVGGYVTFRIQMANDTANDHVKVGEIEIDYKGKM